MSLLVVKGYFGTVCFDFSESEWRLLLIGQHRKIGQFPGSGKSVYVITRVTVLTLSQMQPKDIDIAVFYYLFCYNIFFSVVY